MRTFNSIRVLLLALVVLFLSTASFAQFAVLITIAPPALPVYEQPPCPAEGYIWTPGYWAFDNDFDDYYWVPGTWVEAPEVGLLWTPGYWAWSGNGFFFHEGYWGPQVGFYGGVFYGYGYFGEGYEGGRWDHGRFFYNRSVTNINTTVIRNVYNTTVIHNTTINRVSYNGGNGGINARPTAQQEAATRERHVAPLAVQTQHVQEARNDRQLRASINQGKPPIAATPKPGKFSDREVMPAQEAGAPYRPPANRGNRSGDNNMGARPDNNDRRTDNNGARPDNSSPRSGNVVHPRDLPAPQRPPAPNTGDPRRDQKYQQQQERLQARQDQERQKLQQKQERDHQKMDRQKADDARKQQAEQRHQQQTQQLELKHTNQLQKLQEKQQPRDRNQSRPPGEGRPN